MIKVSNICPACAEPLDWFSCDNENCKCCTKEPRFERLIVKDKEVNDGEGIVACPHCGFEEGYSFWAVQEIELFCATQVTHSFTCAGEMHSKRRKSIENNEADKE